MTKDLDREVIVKYNLLNLPKRVTTSGSDSLLNYKTYNYDATGQKLQVKSFANGSTTLTEDYIGNKIYENSSLSKVLIPGGYVSIAGGVPTIHYYQTDHLGNIRQVLSSDGVLQEQNDYYAFGMRQQRGDYPLLASNKYKYNGKELETFNNFETLDYGARMYDPSIGRWNVVDPLAELKGWLTPYNYCSLNPINRLDPDGMSCVSQISTIDGSVESNTLVTSSNAWYVSIDGSNFIWDPSENPEYKPGYYYLGKRNYSITDKNTGNITFLRNDGTYFWSPGLPSITLIGNYTSTYYWKRILDYIQVSLDGFGILDPTGVADGFNSIIYLARGQGGNALISAVAMLPYLGDIAKIGKYSNIAAKGSTQLWTSTSKMSSVKNAFGHWKKHGAEFPEFLNAKQYVEGAKNFMHNSPAGTLMKTRANGDILKYHPGTNTFGVMDATGVPRTMFRPTDGMKYWLGQ